MMADCYKILFIVYDLTSLGIITGTSYKPEIASAFIDAIARHRFWEREELSKVPA